MLKGVLPAVKNMKDFEKLLDSQHDYIILLESRISQIEDVVKHAKKLDKKVLVHADLIQGLKNDEYGAEFLVRNVKVDGIISTRGTMITFAKKNKVLAIQRLFVLDSHALNHNLKAIDKTRPDYIEILPGLITKKFKEIAEKTNLPIIAGGLINTEEDIKAAYDGGAIAVSTSNMNLWNL